MKVLERMRIEFMQGEELRAFNAIIEACTTYNTLVTQNRNELPADKYPPVCWDFKK